MQESKGLLLFGDLFQFIGAEVQSFIDERKDELFDDLD
jgi:hypothetical protein